MSSIFDCSYPIINSKLFKEYDWFNFYMDKKEVVRTNMPESRRHEVSISMFVDSDLSEDKSTRRILTWVLIFINNSPIHWYSMMQATIEASNFGSNLYEMKSRLEISEALPYKL